MIKRLQSRGVWHHRSYHLEPAVPATITLTRPRRTAALVTLGGEVDLAALDRLCAVLADASGAADVVVDASGVDFIDCCALRPLLACARAASAGGGRLRLRDPSPATVDLITWCRLEEQLPTARARRRPRSLAAEAGAA